ncbi:MAG TPA: hypothetical protein VFB63_17545 [Bryobacteraceae bacterium]|nr:hypothetical protein [Bryobacteraceae bacterium]
MRDSVGLLLVGALCLSAILTLWYAWDHYSSVGELQQIYSRQAAMGNIRAAANSLANEAIDYSRTNPGIDAILFKFDLKPRSGPAATNEPSGKAP